MCLDYKLHCIQSKSLKKKSNTELELFELLGRDANPKRMEFVVQAHEICSLSRIMGSFQIHFQYSGVSGRGAHYHR